MRLPERPDAQRFFARLLQAILECPRCGRLDRTMRQRHTLGGAVDPHRAKRRYPSQTRTHRGYDPQTGRWCCPSCGLVCVLGVIAWPVKRGSRAITRPRDQVPSERELAQMRAQGGGSWMGQAVARGRADESNITAGCGCPGECLIHGQDVPEDP